MSPEVAAIFSVTVVVAGDIITQKMSIGGPDNRVGVLGGALNPILGTPSGAAGSFFIII